MSSRLTCIYQNVRGLNTKLKNIYLTSTDCDFDVIILTETWLKPTICDSEIFCDNYQVFRNDRLNKIGGGVLIAVNNSISCERITMTVHPDAEFLCVHLRYCGRHVILTCSYIPPNSPVDTYMKHVELIAHVTCDRSFAFELISFGDFNLPHISWIPGENIIDYVPVSNSSQNPQLDIFGIKCMIFAFIRLIIFVTKKINC